MTKTVNRLIERATALCQEKHADRALSLIQCILDANGYAEPGYSTKKQTILFSNWNGITEWDNERRESVPIEPDNTIWKNLVQQLEKHAELEWGDEWALCSDCNKAVRTQPNGNGWTQAFFILDGEIICRECAPNHADEILEKLEGKAKNALTRDLGIDPEKHGYTKCQGRFEHGMHEHQAADPKVIGASLRKKGINRFLFMIDDTNMFTLTFSVYVHDDEAEKFSELSDKESDAAISPATLMKQALQQASVGTAELREQQAKEGGVIYTTIKDGKPVTRLVGPEEFIKGIKD